MKRIFTCLFIVFGTIRITSGQQIIHACCDTFVCLPGTPVALSVTIDSGSLGEILNVQDDVYSQVVDLGFSFTFYGNTYSQCVLSTNVYITFDLNQAGNYSPWQITDAAPSAFNPLNAIYGPWQDTDPSVPPFGSMSFGTFGTAPDRFFVFNFCGVPMYNSPAGTGCNDSLFTGQIIVYETTNYIEVHLGHKVSCEAWNNGYAIEGVQDATGNNAVVVAGRNYPDLWAVDNDGIRFTPSGNTYTYAAIPYAPVPFAAGVPVWSTIDGQYVATGYDIEVTPTVTTTYVVTTASCGFSADTVTIVVGSVPAIYDTTHVSCIGINDGSASVIPTDNAPPYSFVWLNQNGDTIQIDNNTTGDTIVNLASGTYTLIFDDALGCTQQHIYTITQPVYGAAFSVSPGLICDGAEVTFNDLSFGTISAYSWMFGDGGTSTDQNPNHTYASTGTYTVTLTITVGNCSATFEQIIEVHPNITGGFTVQAPPYCVGADIQFTESTTGNPAQWNWNFGDGGSSTEQNPGHAYASEGNYTIYFSATDSFCGVAQDSLTISVFHVPDPQLRDDTILCEGAVISVAANDSGDTYLWTDGQTTPAINFVMPADSLFYLWVAVTFHGCTGYDTMLLRNRCIIMLPAAFSPNGDNINDLFHPLASSVKDFDFKVYNRWGEEVYSDFSGDITRGWNGNLNNTMQPVGVYVYFITGHFDSGKIFTLKGNVTLVR
ncbi:MAG: PKD domain-containing protein [Chitinophagales bacterium]